MQDTGRVGTRPRRTAGLGRGDRLKAAVFDLDGTLADTRPALTGLLMKVVAEQGRKVTPRQVAAALGDAPGTAFGRLLGVPDGHSAVVAALARYRELYVQEVLRGGSRLLFPGVAAGLAALRARGTEVAVTTSRPSRGAVLLLDAMGIREHVGPLICQEMVRRVKPHPEAALRAAAELGVLPQECAYVGDTAADMRMAVTAGMTPLAVTYGAGTFAELAAVAETRMCATFTDVVAAVSTAVRPAPAAVPVAARRR
ncbi:HAD family hydrolase [Streptomyces sp. NPDC059740]|uniref:HAD family hydrolase n=1 Tax=Streptomyces sp. NPDC059740 TaxID=3346926 RepID=UPI00364E076A